jgi:hypothetical protein
VADQIQFSSDGTIHSMDGQVLNRGVQNPSALSDAAKAHVGVRVNNTTDTFRYQQNAGPATATSKVTSVQLQQPTGRVAILGTTVEPEVYERMKETSPEAFLPEAEKLAEAAAAEADAAAAEAERASMNTHPDAFIEESHTQFTNVVPAQLQTELLVQMNRDGVPSTGTLNRVAESLGVSVDEAVTRLNAMSAGVQAQLSVLAKARGVNPERFANWARDNHRGESLRAMQGHVQGRQLLSWDTLIAEFKARGQHDPLR